MGQKMGLDAGAAHEVSPGGKIPATTGLGGGKQKTRALGK